MAVDWDKPIRTKSGRKARLVYTLVGVEDHEYRRVVAVTYPHSSRETIFVHRDDGILIDEDDCIVNTPHRHVLWLNVYESSFGPRASGFFSSKGAADLAVKDVRLGRLACIRIEFEEGEGL